MAENRKNGFQRTGVATVLTNNRAKRDVAFRTIWKQLPYPVVVTATEYSIQYVNPAFEVATGYPVAEILGQPPPYSFWPGEYGARYKRDLSGEKSGRIEWQIKRKNGKNWWAEVSQAHPDKTGRYPYHLFLLIDISARKQLEEDLRQSQEKFNSLFDAIPIPLAISSLPEQRFVQVNKSFLMIGELEREEVIGAQSMDLRWKDHAEAERVAKESLEQGRTDDIEMSLISKSGQLHTSLLKAEVVKLGERKYVVSASIDITGRKKTEKALQESEARFRMLSENTLSGIFILRNGQFSYVNPAFAAMLGRSREDLVGCNPVTLVHPEDWEMVDEAFHRRLKGEQTNLQYDFRCLRGDGKIVWLEALSARFEDEKQPALLGTVLDITEQRRVKEEADRLRQVMSHVSRVNTLGELAASLAHELNQPLTAIMANAQAALRMVNNGPVNSREITEILEDIASDDCRAGDIIRRMREPLKRGQLTLEMLDVNYLIKEIYQLVRNDAVIAGVAIDLKLETGLPPIKGDRTQLQQVLLNLMVNALDAVKERTVGPRWIEVHSTADPGRLVKVEVRDSGFGIPENNRERLFELLSTTKPDGLGVGLAISKHLIQDHGGRIWQENRPEGGASFFFTLPMEREAVAEG
jgi:PAS domain S-box-containing protein